MLSLTIPLRDYKPDLFLCPSCTLLLAVPVSFSTPITGEFEDGFWGSDRWNKVVVFGFFVVLGVSDKRDGSSPTGCSGV